MTPTSLFPRSEAMVGRSSALPAILLRIEGMAIFGAAMVAYLHLDAGWWLFALLILAPDLSMLGYLLGSAPGARIYNVAHTLSIPLLVLVWAFWVGAPGVIAGTVVWIAHIGMDRAAGFGLKYPDSFRVTHLQRLG